MSTLQNKKCGKCDKIVYPTEEIKCLDKFWHKGCLKCTVCGMTLNVKNVKGYDKMPYCNAHYPQPKATVVVDNPEMQRIRLLTDIQSNAKYHEDFNKNKGKFTVVTDDPALIRAKEQQRIVSQAEYTGKRKDSTSQMIAPDNHRESDTSNTNTRELRNSQSTIGRVADFDPINDNHGSLARGYEPASKAVQNNIQNVSKNFVSLNKKLDNSNVSGNTSKNSSHQSENEEQHSSNDTHHVDQSKKSSRGDNQTTQMKVRALYSYTAAESDEISFDEGDILVECQQIDAGWMLGRNSKTGQQGLLPSNYVEIIN